MTETLYLFALVHKSTGTVAALGLNNAMGMSHAIESVIGHSAITYNNITTTTDGLPALIRLVAKRSNTLYHFSVMPDTEEEYKLAVTSLLI